MRIVLFHATLPQPDTKPGGVEVVVHRLAEALAKNDRDIVTVVSLTPAPPGADYEHRQVFSRAPWLHEHQPARLTILPALLNAVRWPAADVVHFHGDDWFLRRRRWATVRSFHGSALRESQSATSRRRRALILVHPLERLAGRLATWSCATDEDTRHVLCTDDVLPFGVDTDRFSPGPKEPRPTILFVGTWHGRKRGHRVYEAFTQDLLLRCPDAQLWMVCDVVPPPHESVRHFSAPDDGGLADLYRRAWVFAYPSTYEGFGLVYLEAMASGTAVLATPNEATDRFLGDGRGRVVAEADLGPAMHDLLRDSATRGDMGIRGRTFAGRFAWPEIARRHRETYAEAIARYRSRSAQP
jgi:phosphatidyl-myo-inositol alpha-mannosyltransferase